MNESKNKQEIMAYLEHESGRWVGFRDRCDRTANLDRELTNQRDATMDRLNLLLEELHTLNILEQVGGILQPV